MLSKRSSNSFLLLVLITLSACIPTPTPPPPTQTPVPPTNTPPPPLTVHDKCLREENDMFISPQGEYCFAHPFGYSVSHQTGSGNIPDALILLNNPTNINNSDPSSITCPYPTTLKLYFEGRENEESLNEFVFRKTQMGIEKLYPWSLSNKDAYIAKKYQDSTVIYYIFTRNKERFYTLEFSLGIPNISISSQNPCADQLEKLLFTVLETFTFLK